MTRIATWLGLGLIFAPPADGSNPLPIRVIVAPRPHFVGQAIEVQVEVDPARGTPIVEPPRVPGADVVRLPSDPARPSVRFVVIPGRAGPLDLPPFRARSGDRSGASRPVKLTVANVPTDGRPSAFLGGVGPFEVGAEAEPAGVRLGESLEARITVSGPAAFGSVRPPSVAEWSSPALKIEAKGDRIEAGKVPVRTFLYRIRPLKPGTVRLSPVAIAAFDPTTRRYATRATSSLAIRVEEPPRFDPAILGEPPASTAPTSPRSVTVALAAGGLAVASGSILAAWMVARRRRARRPVDPRKLAVELANGLSDPVDEIEAARAVAEALTAYLHRVGGRTPGALTPPEAGSGFDRLFGDAGLASGAESLLSRCDRARFGGETEESSGLIAEGRRFFEAVAGAKEGGGRRPGVAAETARGI